MIKVISMKTKKYLLKIYKKKIEIKEGNKFQLFQIKLLQQILKNNL